MVLSVRLIAIVGLVAALILLQWDTYESMVGTWLSSSTYRHGFAIPLLAVFFAWQRREEALHRPVSVWWPGLLGIGALSALWALAVLVNVQVVAQFASVALIGAIAICIAGLKQGALFALPLGYLVFMVPFGQGIVPLLMEWTADFTVGSLYLVGIPVIRDGLYFSTPSGNFEVAEACAGLRFLIASLAAGVAFAFHAYSGWKKRMYFIVASAVVPIVANGLRAFVIVLIAHYSDMKLATGIDHFIYGWVIFAVVMLLFFFVGVRFADQSNSTTLSHSDGAVSAEWGRSRIELAAATGLGLLMVVGAFAIVEFRSHAGLKPQPALPDSTLVAAGWSGPVVTDVDWQLGYKCADALVEGAYRSGDRAVEVRIAAYGRQVQGAELINSTNRIAGDGWQIEALGGVNTGSEILPTVQAKRIVRGAQSYLVWYWYQQGSEVTASSYGAKWRELLAVFQPSPAAVVAIAVLGRRRECTGYTVSFCHSRG